MSESVEQQRLTIIRDTLRQGRNLPNSECHWLLAQLAEAQRRERVLVEALRYEMMLANWLGKARGRMRATLREVGALEKSDAEGQAVQEAAVSLYDRAHIGDLVAGEGDWFSAHLFRLMAKADLVNRARLASIYPEHGQVFHEWETGGQS